MFVYTASSTLDIMDSKPLEIRKRYRYDKKNIAKLADSNESNDRDIDDDYLQFLNKRYRFDKRYRYDKKRSNFDNNNKRYHFDKRYRFD